PLYAITSYGPSPILRHPSFPTRRSSDLPRSSGFRPRRMRRPPCPRDENHRRSANEGALGTKSVDRRHRSANSVRPPHRHIGPPEDRKSTRLNSSHVKISYAVFCLKKKTN